MGKGDNRRPRDEKVSDEEYGDRWEKAFGKPPAPSREAAKAPRRGFALLLGDGYTAIPAEEKTDE